MGQQGVFDVGVVGYGPVGATLANLLGREGFSAALFEREGAQYHLPRAAHFDGEVMRVFQAAGLAEQVAETTFVNVGMQFVNAAGKLLIDWPRPQEVGPQGWHASYRFHQPALEAVLRRGVDRFPRHRALFRHDVFALDQEDACVRVRHEDLSRGVLGETRCRYVVGCDGARSTVRRFMGSALEDLGSHERWLVVDLVLHEAVPTLKDQTIQLCDPARPTTVARGVGLRRRWEFMLMPDDDLATVAQPEQVWRLLRPWLRPDQARIERAVPYVFHSVLAHGWRRGRLLLAGDAAHQTPPFLGQGMCAGIRDAANLTWKLAAVLRGEAAESLLDTYESERAPHARAYIEQAIRLGGLVQVTDPAEASERDRAMEERPELMASITPTLGPGLHGEGPPAGTLSEQPRQADGTRLDDLTGMRFVLLAAPALLRALPRPDRDALDAAGVQVRQEGQDYLARLGRQAVLVRPDRYVLGAADLPAELRALLDLLPVRQRPPWAGRAPDPAGGRAGAGAGALDAAASGALDAARRAMPLQRLAGNGMDLADAAALHAMAERRVPWTEAACWLGEAKLRRADAARCAGHAATARLAYFRAAACFRFAQSPMVRDTPEKAAVYRRALDAFGQGAALADPPYEKLEIPHRGAALYGWLMLPSGVRRPPGVIIFGGADGWKEEYHDGALALLARGVAALLLDGPGQGETRILGGMHLHPRVEAAFSAAAGHLLAHPRLGGRVGTWGNSLGGTLAARTAASDPRLAACCVNGGSAAPVEVLDRFPRFIERIKAMLGSDDAGEDDRQARAALDDLALGAAPPGGGPGRAGRIACPLLVLHGGADAIFAAAGARRILDLADHADAQMVLWDDGDHCIYNHSEEKHCLVADWFADRLSNP